RHDRSTNLVGARLLLFFEQRSARYDEVPPIIPVFDDPECVDAPDVHGRIGGAGDVDLRDRTESALPADAHLVTALHLAFDFAFHRQVRAEGFGELLVGRSPASEPAGELQTTGRRNDAGVNP